MQNGISLSMPLMSDSNLSFSYRNVKQEPIKDYGDQLIHLQDALALSPAVMCTNDSEEKLAAGCINNGTFLRERSRNQSFLSIDTKFFSTPLLDDIHGRRSPTVIDACQNAKKPYYNRVDATSLLGPLPSPLVPNVLITGESQFTAYHPRLHGSGRAHSEGYSSCSSNQSQTSPNISCQKEHACCAHIRDGVGDSGKLDWSPVDNFLSSPPTEYTDHASDSGFTAGDISLTQESVEAVSDFFSQCGSISTPDSLYNTPQDLQYTGSNVEGQEHHCNCRDHPIVHTAEASGSSVSPVSTISSSKSSIHSPTPKRRRLGACSLDTGVAQKSGGVTEAVRKTAMMKAIIEMRKMGYAAESIHLGAYIMDKCLDSFHVACQALPDVCAVSMVLGTKIEEYESLRPGTLNGLVGASRNKKRLCHIEKRIIHELASGLCFPTPLVLANFMLAHLHSNEEQARFVHYLLDLALLESRFRDEAGSRLAHAAVCISAAVVNNNKVRNSECRALVEAEHRLSKFTQTLCGSTRDVMGELIIEMEKAVDERNAVLVEYLAEDKRRVCFCEVPPALWNFIHKDSHIRIRNDKESGSTVHLAKWQFARCKEFWK